MGYSGARGTLIYEKNLKAKISCQTPFKTQSENSKQGAFQEKKIGPFMIRFKSTFGCSIWKRIKLSKYM